MKNESVSCLTRMKYLIIKWMLSGDCGIVWTFSDPAGQRSHTITAESAKEQEGTSVCWPRYTPFSFYCLWRNDHVFSVGNWFYLYENKQMMLFLKGEMDGLAYTPPVQCSRQQRACVHPSLCLAHRWDERDMSQSNMSLCLRKWDATDEVRINPKGKLVSHPSGKPWHAVAGRRDNSQKLKIVLKSIIHCQNICMSNGNCNRPLRSPLLFFSASGLTSTLNKCCLFLRVYSVTR